MPRLILENQDIEDMIKERYPNAEIIEGLDEQLEIVIRIKEIDFRKATRQTIEPKIVEPLKQQVRLNDGSIDAKTSGLTLDNRPQTIPGGAMGRDRGTMKMF